MSILYRIETAGDPSVGIQGDCAEVLFYGEWEPADECDAYRKQALKDAFGDILDGPCTVVRLDPPAEHTHQALVSGESEECPEPASGCEDVDDG